MLSRSSFHDAYASRPRRAALLAAGLTTLLLLATLPPVGAAETALPPLGMSVASISGLTSAGAAPRYGSYWVGDWMATSGWGGFDSAMRTAKTAGATPVVYWYYWGDSIAPTCFDADGCNGRSEAEWNTLTDQLVAHLTSTLGGSEALVVLENEFNKGGITGDYAPTFDAKLEKIALKLKTVSGVKLIVGFGNWGEASWAKFPKTIAASEYVGYQMMRASTKDTEASYRAAADRSAYLASYIATSFNKPSFLYDLALSSYPDASWETIQAETLNAIFAKLQSSGTTGLQGVVYRSLNDNYMDPANYYGLAESHWGLRTKDGVAKPAFDVWVAHAKGTTTTTTTPPPPPPANVPGSFEAEKMTATKGGLKSNASASGGAMWNLWSNGELSTTLVSDAPYDARISVVAVGQLAGGIAPRMEIRLGSTLLGAYDVPVGFGKYTADARIPAGNSSLRILFTNDAVVGTEDRNLLVDVATVGARPIAPPPPPENVAPTASFAHAENGLLATFDASASRDPEGSALTYAWVFGDGSTATGVAPSHTYGASGTYRVTLTVSDGGLASSASADITVVKPNSAPLAAFTSSASGLAASFDASGSSDADGDALTYTWSFGDGASGSGVALSHTYAASGSYRVTLTVSDGKADATSAADVGVVKPNAAPVAGFTSSASGLSATFDASGSSDADGDALTYAWSFGDGSTSNGVTATHAYSAAGTYRVTLTVNDGKASATSAADVVAVQPNRAPVARASVSGANDTFSFDGSASTDADGDALAYTWTLGDGTTASGARVSHTYATSGNYTVTLTVSDGRGLSGSTSVLVRATKPAPVPFAASFSGVTGNDWWVQTSVAANKPLASVCATVDAGACQALTLRSYGWATSFYVPSGSIVKFRATASSGESVVSGGYRWPDATPVSSTATFTPYDGKTTWVQTRVASDISVKSVCATLNGGACKTLTYRSWDAWAAGLKAPTGTKVVFYATLADGMVVRSATYTWPVR